MDNKHGKITTFYSFKGGVGRTMALANVAFFAASNGMRVLVMDWDLEAPGLAYYFRGLLDPMRSKNLKDAPGLLNIFWRWRSAVRSMPPKELEAELACFNSGAPFKDCVRTLISREDGSLPGAAALDYISAGSRKIQIENASEPIDYEEAMARFSWQYFFDKQAGGAILEALRDWCKRDYDLILIDSRTGLADVAGICTMQMPDEVILCFILNRQNIDGVSRIAQTIRSKRKDGIALRAVPMRTAGVNTSEESDAHAKAIRELTRVGEFSADQLKHDFALAIWATEGVPFYETLTPLLQGPNIEVLNASYRQLASQIAGKQLETPVFPSAFKEQARRRLQPRYATADYIKGLSSAEPTRAATEIARLLESAYEEQADGSKLDDEYVLVLVDAALSLEEESFFLEPDVDNVGERALDLLHALYEDDNEHWSLHLLHALERYWNSAAYRLADDQQLSILEEIDGLLADSGSMTGLLSRISYRLITATVYYDAGEDKEAKAITIQCRALIKSLRDYPLSPDQAESLALEEAELYRLEGDIKQKNKEIQAAIKSYESGIRHLLAQNENPRSASVRMLFTLHERLARLYTPLDNREAVKHALAAAEITSGARGLLGAHFSSLAVPIVASQNSEHALTFCESALLQESVRSSGLIAGMAGRSPALAVEMIGTASNLAEMIGRTPDTRAKSALDALSNVAKSALIHLNKRRGALGKPEVREVTQAMNDLRARLDQAGWNNEEEAAQWQEILSSLNGRNRAKITVKKLA